MKSKQMVMQPMYTEKIAKLQDELNKYAFRVDASVNKIEIKKAVEAKFEVKVKNVHTMIVNGKKRQQMTRGGRFEGRRPSWKKAIVTLESGHKLELFGNA